MVNEPDENHLQSEKDPIDSNLGFTTQEALKRLSEEIEQVVHLHETRFKSHR